VFEKFRQKKRIEAIANSPIGKMVDQVALAVAVAQMTSDYVQSRNGVSITKDEDASVLEIWSGVRLEAISQLWGPGPISLELIIDPAKHPKLLDALIERSNSYLHVSKSPQNEISATFSAMLRVYDVLAQLDFDVCSPYLQTDRQSKGYVAPYAGLVEEMRKLHVKWQGFMYAIHTKADFLPATPDTVFETLWRDVTYRSKVIASCARFGPHYLATFAALKKEGCGGQREHQGPRRSYHQDTDGRRSRTLARLIGRFQKFPAFLLAQQGSGVMMAAVRAVTP
jgi:hypothetical protein